MSLRISSTLAAFVLLPACGAPESPPPPGTKVDCAPAGVDEFSAQCTAEVSAEGGTRFVVLWNPDGSFHRLRATGDERWLEAADGAEQARVEYAESTLTIGIGGDRYMLQADLMAPKPGG
ncbi:hypothetical protein [Porphyrobacter sp. ULC335]|uniref:hypothetical protein n=1 Tax=Porphyrobacter sp. ULC335 TaxID=2854260 RepID=UPI0022208F5E|nr:hypothetical protein [Porphyrobacter sp. ULC335]UYV14924.1 hypothetical protein KVF90_12375 [Porphyrobacter sp. ULC335]